MKKYKLKRPIRNAADTEDITEVSIQEEDEMSAGDFYEVIAIPSGANLAEAVANVCGLTSSQVASMSLKDYSYLAHEVGKFIQ